MLSLDEKYLWKTSISLHMEALFCNITSEKRSHLLNIHFTTLGEYSFQFVFGGGRAVRWSLVNFQCRASYYLDDSRARAYCACSRCGWGVVWTFLLSSILSFLSPSLWETARYRLKYCLKGPLNPKQPTNQNQFVFNIADLKMYYILPFNVSNSNFSCFQT